MEGSLILAQGPKQETGTRDPAVEDHEIQGLEAYGAVEIGLLCWVKNPRI